MRHIDYSFRFLQELHQVESNDEAGEYDGNGGAELDEDVEGRAGSIFERIADCVTDNSCLVVIGALAAVVASFDVFLCVIPGTACVGHEYCHCKAGNGNTAEKTYNTFASEDETGEDRNDDS